MGSFLMIPLAAVGVILAAIVWRFGIPIPIQEQTDSSSSETQFETLEEIPGQRFQTMLEAFRRSNEPGARLVALEADLAEIVDSWPETLAAVRASQMSVAALLQESGAKGSTEFLDEMLDQFVQRALTQPSLYFSESVSYASSYVIATAVSHLNERDDKTGAWRLCRDVRWRSKSLPVIKEACDEVWSVLSFPIKFWQSMDSPPDFYEHYTFDASVQNFVVVYRNLKYRFNPYSGKYLRQLAEALYSAGEYDLVELLKGELLALDIFDAQTLESELATLRGKRFPGVQLPDWSVRVK